MKRLDLDALDGSLMEEAGPRTMPVVPRPVQHAAPEVVELPPAAAGRRGLFVAAGLGVVALWAAFVVVSRPAPVEIETPAPRPAAVTAVVAATTAPAPTITATALPSAPPAAASPSAAEDAVLPTQASVATTATPPSATSARTAPPAVVAASPVAVRFAFDADEADSTSLKAAVAAAGRCSGTIEIVGHTCDLGDAAYNESLSLSRARRVAAALTDAGVPVDRLLVRGAGPSPASSLADRRALRRVDVSCNP